MDQSNASTYGEIASQVAGYKRGISSSRGSFVLWSTQDIARASTFAIPDVLFPAVVFPIKVRRHQEASCDISSLIVPRLRNLRRGLEAGFN